jgi:nucleoside-diphosphate-sugar epimerase
VVAVSLKNTGANGFVGSHLGDLLLSEGNLQVRTLVRKSADLRWLENKPVELAFAELTGSVENLMPAVRGVEVVYHIAGATKTLRKQTLYDVNQRGTEKLIQACLAQNPQPKRMIIMSSAGAVGPSPTDEPLNEDVQPRPVTEYGRSKLAGEEVARGYMDRLSITILRPAAVYGPRDMELLPLFKSIGRGVAPRPGLYSGRLNMCHGQDAARAAIQVAQTEAAGSETFFIGGENTDQRTMAQVAAQALGRKRLLHLAIPKPIVRLTMLTSSLAEKIGRKPRIFKHQNARRILARNWTLDDSKARRVFGYQPHFDLTSGVKNTIDWYLSRNFL